MVVPYSQFFLAGGSNIIQYETIEISHPNFSKVYRIVRNAANGLTATLEDSSVATFDYYPVKITPSGSYNDIDQQLEVSFGDLGQVLPQELDRLLADRQDIVNAGALLGAWCDSSGQMLLPPFLVGNGGEFFVPWQATQLQLGINDDFFFDNAGGPFVATINGVNTNVGCLVRPFTYTAGVLNDAYPYSPSSSIPPVIVPVTGGDTLFVSVTGTIKISGSAPLTGPTGNPAVGPTGVPGIYVPVPSLPKTVTKPKLRYRTFRSDDLSGVLYGPIDFDVVAIPFKKEGATLQCFAPRINLVSTGEIYAVDRFPMLYGFM